MFLNSFKIRRELKQQLSKTTIVILDQIHVNLFLLEDMKLGLFFLSDVRFINTEALRRFISPEDAFMSMYNN